MASVLCCRIRKVVNCENYPGNIELQVSVMNQLALFLYLCILCASDWHTYWMCWYSGLFTCMINVCVYMCMMQSKAGPDESHQEHCAYPDDYGGGEGIPETVVGVESVAFSGR